MKKATLMIAIAAILGACASDKSSDINAPDGELGIAMSSGVMVTTKAPIETTSTDRAPATALDVAFLRLADASGSVAPTWDAFTSAPTVVSTSNGPGVVNAVFQSNTYQISGVDAPGEIIFSPAQMYNASQTLDAHFVGLYPRAIYGNDASNYATAKWTINGTTDILLSNHVHGNKSNNAVTPHVKLAPVFKHQLAWLEFYIVADDANAIQKWGNIQSITIKNQKDECVAVLNPALNGDIADSDVTYAFSTLNPTGVSIPTKGRADAPVSAKGLTVKPTLPAVVTDNETAYFFSQALVAPGEASYSINVVSVANSVPTTSNVTVTFDGNASSVKGNRHLITLTFKASTIEARGTILPWVVGTPGGAEID